MRYLGFALIYGLLAMSLFAAPPDDGLIADQVARRLAGDPDVKCGACKVDVKDGVVTIEGEVELAKWKEKATKLAKKVKGVKSVDNKLTFKRAS